MREAEVVTPKNDYDALLMVGIEKPLQLSCNRVSLAIFSDIQRLLAFLSKDEFSLLDL